MHKIQNYVFRIYDTAIGNRIGLHSLDDKRAWFYPDIVMQWSFPWNMKSFGQHTLQGLYRLYL